VLENRQVKANKIV